MRHNLKGRKLGKGFAHTKAMKRSLVQALFLNDRIKTVESRAKEIRPDVDKIITWAKKGDLHSRRLAIAALGNNKDLVHEIFEKVAQGMFKDRKGGYTRIMKLGKRKGDNATVVIMELVMEPVGGKAKAAPAKKTTPKKVEKAADKKADGANEAKEASKAEAEAKPAAEASEKDASGASEQKAEEASKESAPEAKDEAKADATEEAKPEAAEKEEAKAE